MNNIDINIDRIILDNLDVTADRTQRIRGMIEMELQRMLEIEGINDAIHDSDISHLDTTALNINGPMSDNLLASNIAQRIACALRDLGR